MGELETVLAKAGCKVDAATGAVTAPIHLATTFERDTDLHFSRGYVYGRVKNPTRDMFEQAMAAAEGGTEAAAVSSGVTAATLVFQAALGGRGAHVLFPDDVYHGNRVVLRSVLEPWGMGCTEVDMTDGAAVGEHAARHKDASTLVVWVETPSNPMAKVSDIRRICEVVRHNCPQSVVVVDATFATPCLMQPLALGADLVVHSLTKYIGGHSDLTGGVVVCGHTDNGKKLFTRCRELQWVLGMVLGPQDCWLAMRGLRSLSARMKVHCYNAKKVAEFLNKHPNVERVYHCALPEHPGHDIARATMKDFGATFSFCVKGGRDDAVGVVARLKLFIRATSLGGTESLAEHRASIEAQPTRTPENLIRLHVGLENPDDLIHDLDQALTRSKL
mmetsp:Transcript_35631/g.79963  ORF Transcript_35631/g.79963 Transcript_35631/m.79963 type:complete len:389 (+) Transcript_35631:83-1249(+)